VAGEHVVHEGDDEKIEGVERPPEESGKKGVACV
jgi:hypothetical protein